MAQNTISWDRPMLKRLKSAAKAAARRGEASFVFDGNVFDVGYAKYLIEYLESKLSK